MSLTGHNDRRRSLFRDGDPAVWPRRALRAWLRRHGLADDPKCARSRLVRRVRARMAKAGGGQP